jgi:single-stranded-DNA-specific exonuclease
VTVGYNIAPRINAAGRMGDSNRAVRLLTTADYQEAISLAGDLINDNKKRQEIEMQIFEMAKEQIRNKNNTGDKGIIVVYEKGWHQGVIGIVASRLVEMFHRSVIIFGGEDGFYKGSARSAGDESILEAIEFAGRHVLQFGGHKKAAGLIVSDKEMGSFLQSIQEFSRLHPSEEVVDSMIKVDFEIPFEQINLDNAMDISQMAPFGEGNPQPLFVCRNMTVQQIRFLSSGKHTKMMLGSSAYSTDSSGQLIQAIAFGFSEKNQIFSSGDRIDAVFSLEQNEWNGTKSVEIILKDIQKTNDGHELGWTQIEDFYLRHPEEFMSFIKKESVPVKDVIPQKSDFIAVYQYLKTNHSGDAVLCDLDLLADLISNNYQISITVFKLARIFDIFMEVDVIHFTRIEKYRIKFQLLDVLSKVSLANSRTYKALCIESVIS